ncbi:MAG TPA: S8 family serine peptidase [Solirubrobacteraceae bacterium]|nr:S8 family serine peptidase [Solirubrobacteraceae bacterium]
MRPLLALLLMLGLLGAESANARAAKVTVVVSAEPGQRAAARHAVARSGGDVGQRLDIVHGFTARVPRSAIARLRRSDAIRSVARDVPLHLSDETATVEPAPESTPEPTPEPEGSPEPGPIPSSHDTPEPGSSPEPEPESSPEPDPASEPVAGDSAAAPIDPPPAEIPTDALADDIAREVLADATEDTTVGSLAPDPVAAGEDAEPVAAGADAVLDPTAPVELQPEDGAARARASMDAVRADIGAQGSALTGAGVDVAIIDSGVIGVGALGGPSKLVRAPDFSEDAFDANLRGLDTFGHGSHMAGLIAGDDPATGFRGVAPGARLVSVKVAGADGITSLVRVLMALDWVRRNRNEGGLRIRVLNLSLGVDAQRAYVAEPLAYAAEALWHRGVAVVAAAGNQADGTGRLDLPASDPWLIAVGAAVTGGNAVAGFSSRDAVRAPDLVAPGTSIVSMRVPGSTLDEEFPIARIGNDFFRGSGTSQAAAVISGLAALLIEARPDLSPNQLKALLRAGAVDLPDDVSADGRGLANLANSLTVPTPSPETAAQPFARAVLDLRILWSDLISESMGEGRTIGAGENGWTGRRWSGRRWSGRRWSGRRWSSDEWGTTSGTP